MHNVFKFMREDASLGKVQERVAKAAGVSVINEKYYEARKMYGKW